MSSVATAARRMPSQIRMYPLIEELIVLERFAEAIGLPMHSSLENNSSDLTETDALSRSGMERLNASVSVTVASLQRSPTSRPCRPYVESRFGRGAPKIRRRHALRIQRARTIEHIEVRLDAPRRPAVSAGAFARRPRRAKPHSRAGEAQGALRRTLYIAHAGKTWHIV